MRTEIRTVGRVAEGEVREYTVHSPDGLAMSVITLGATLTSLRVPDAHGVPGEVTLCYPTAAELVSKGNPPFFGATVGRFANRIGAGVFTVDGRTCRLECNDGPNHLHGGRAGYATRLWGADTYEDREGFNLRFTLVSADGDQGYPGRLSVTALYTLDGAGGLAFSYEAQTEAPTIVNLTNHTYWNLGGTATVLDHELELNAGLYLESDAALLPTGRLTPVAGTAFDFTSPHAVGDRIGEVGLGYDHCYVVEGGGGADLVRVAELHDAASGRHMAVSTTQPGVQLYTGNFLERAGFRKHQALCLETQNYPDSPNRPMFPSPVLRPGQVYRQRTVHRFSSRR